MGIVQLAYVEALRGNGPKAASLRNAALSLVADDPKALKKLKEQLALDGLIREGLYHPVDPLTALSPPGNDNTVRPKGQGKATGRKPDTADTLAARLKDRSANELRKAAYALRVERHDAESAVLLLGVALGRAREAGDRIGEILTLEQLAWAFEDQGNSEEALTQIHNALAAFEEMLKSDKKFLQRFVEASARDVKPLISVTSRGDITDRAAMLKETAMSPCTTLALLHEGDRFKGSLATLLDEILSFRVITAGQFVRHVKDLRRETSSSQQNSSKTTGGDFLSRLQSQVSSSEFQSIASATIVLKFLEAVQPAELSVDAINYFKARTNLSLGEREVKGDLPNASREHNIRESLRLLDSLSAGEHPEFDPSPATLRIRALRGTIGFEPAAEKREMLLDRMRSLTTQLKSSVEKRTATLNLIGALIQMNHGSEATRLLDDLKNIKVTDSTADADELKYMIHAFQMAVQSESGNTLLSARLAELLLNKTPAKNRATLLIAVAHLQCELGRTDSAAHFAQEALKLAEDKKDDALLFARARLELARIARKAGDLRDCLSHYWPAPHFLVQR